MKQLQQTHIAPVILANTCRSQVLAIHSNMSIEVSSMKDIDTQELKGMQTESSVASDPKDLSASGDSTNIGSSSNDGPESEGRADSESKPRDSPKKVKFSSYMSNFGQRKLELAEQERKKKQEKELRLKEEGERLSNEADEHSSKIRENQVVLEKELADREKQAEIKADQGKTETLELDRVYFEEKKLLSELEDNNVSTSDKERQREVQPQNKDDTPIVDTPNSTFAAQLLSQETSANYKVKNVLHIEPEQDGAIQTVPTLSGFESEKPASTLNQQQIDLRPVINEDLNSSELEDIDSDAETVISSPRKFRRGRLVTKSELDEQRRSEEDDDTIMESVHNHSAFDNEESYLQDDLDDEYSDLSATKKNKITTSRQHLLSNSRSASPGIKGKAEKKPKKKTGRDSGGRLKLQKVCQRGSHKEAKQLIEDGSDVNDQDYAGNSALHEAALEGHHDIVELLLQNGANVNLQNGPDDLETPLIDAVTNNHLRTVEILLKYGADPTIENAHGQNAMDFVDDELEDSDKLASMLKKAALTKRNKLKADHNDGDPSGQDVRSRSRSKGRSQSRPAHARNELLFVDVNSKKGRDELYQRASDGDAQYVGTYLASGGKPDAEAMSLAAKYGHVDCVSLFLGFGSEVNYVNQYGLTALMRTVGRGHFEVVKLLCEAGADLSIKSRDGKNIIDHARDALMSDANELQYLTDVMSSKAQDPEQGGISEKRSDFPSEVKVKKRKISPIDGQTEHKKKRSDQTTEAAKKEHSIKPRDKGKAPSISERSNSNKRASPTVQQQHIPALPQPSVQRKVSQPSPVPTESEEAKLERLEKEKRERSQYESARQQQSVLRNQEFLDRLEADEKRRRDELKRQEELREQERRKHVELMKIREAEVAAEREKMNLEKERDERSKIREGYPYALRAASFDNTRSKEDVLVYLPLFHWQIDNVDYVTDIQMILILGLEKFREKYAPLYHKDKILSLEVKSKIFDILYAVLRDNSPEASNLSFKERADLKDSEFRKFYAVEIHWIRLDKVLEIIQRDYNYLESVLRTHLQPCSLDRPPNEYLVKLVDPSYVTNHPLPVVSDSQRDVQLIEQKEIADLRKTVPFRLRFRTPILKTLVRNKKIW